ncbi:MAG: DUF3991 and TOPRIM domain-containing protein [Clostridia bacterium]|nr:DUF3991 and TOPRIM domain-containing protein [Clostridia bacterium]
MGRPKNFADLLEQARSKPDLRRALDARGISIKKAGRARAGWRWRTTDKKGEDGDLSSVVFIECADGSWFAYDNKQRTGKLTLDAIDVMTKLVGVEFDDAIYLLTGGSIGSAPTPAAVEKVKARVEAVASLPPLSFKEAELPKKNHAAFKMSFAYLMQTRCIPYALVNSLMAQGIIYGGTKRSKNSDTTHPYVVFPIINRSGKIVGADLRSPLSGSSFRQIAYGSNPNYAWGFRYCIDKIELDTPIFFCESPLDAMSLCALTEIPGVYISLGGVKDMTMRSMVFKLGGTPVITVDNDDGGRKFAARNPSYNDMLTPSVEGVKDWNDLLKHYIETGKDIPMMKYDKVNVAPIFDGDVVGMADPENELEGDEAEPTDESANDETA